MSWVAGWASTCVAISSLDEGAGDGLRLQTSAKAVSEADEVDMLRIYPALVGRKRTRRWLALADPSWSTVGLTTAPGLRHVRERRDAQ
jgi:hypothetical protein